MVIKALVDLYERLLEQKLVAPEGWDKQKIGYKIVLGRDGTLKDIVSIKEAVKRGKKEKFMPRAVMLPKAVVRSQGFKSNFLWDNAAYVFGYNPDNPERGRNCFYAFCKKHHMVLDDCSSEIAMAILRFLNAYDPSDLKSHPVLLKHADVLSEPVNFSFSLEEGEVSDLARDKDIQKAWDRYLNEVKTDDAVYGICDITGKRNQKIARIHPKIKGIFGADASGCALVSFNVRSVCSYGYDRMQSINSHISEYAAAAYSKALNYLLSDDSHHSLMGGVTVVYWSETNTSEYGKCFDTLLNGSLKGSTYSLDTIMDCLFKGKSVSLQEEELDPKESFYIIGLSSGGARASVRFFWKDSFGHILENLYKHQMRLLVDRPETVHSIPLYLLLKAAASPGSEISSPVLDVLFKSILNDAPYPPSLYFNMLHRTFLDTDDKKKGITKVNYIKAGMIKAYLVKNCYDRWKEMDSVRLNENCNKTPYLLGRLFAVLESIQRNALPTINTTIKDRFFNSACTTPAVTFPILIRLSQGHLKKIKKPLSVFFDKKVTDLLDRMTMNSLNGALPNRLTPEEQGAFILGYYQERQAVFHKNSKKETEKVDSKKEK